MKEIVLKLVGIVGATIVAYGLATTQEGVLRETHPLGAIALEVIALIIIFLD